MSLAHKVAFEIINKQKHSYVKGEDFDYSKNRLNEKKNIKEIPSDVECVKDEFGEYLSCKDNPKDKIIYYIHGGGFCFGSSASKRMFTLYVAKELHYNIYTVDYRLAPEFPYPNGLNDCVLGYLRLIDEYGSENISIVGESAGGNLIVALILELNKKKISLPRKIVLISPSLQYLEVTKSYIDNNDTDCMVDGNTFIQEIQDVYLKTNDINLLKTADYSPLFGDYSNFPKTYLIVSDSEVLYDDAVRFKERMDFYKRDCQIDVYHNLMHAFPIITYFKESRKALKKVKKFLDTEK